jgi:hypothetical protein
MTLALTTRSLTDTLDGTPASGVRTRAKAAPISRRNAATDVRFPGASSEAAALVLQQLPGELDLLVPAFREGDSVGALGYLISTLDHVRARVSASEWTDDVVRICRDHELFDVVQEDPYTARAYQKPRGYAGDAVMLDYIYHGAPAGTTERGARLLRGTAEGPNGHSILWRRDLIAEELDRVARDLPGARVLAVASGHLREAEVSRALRSGRIRELVALDQDAESLARIERDCTALPVTVCEGSVKHIIRGKLDLGGFDLVYAAGLYDYLTDRTALALSRSLQQLLRPGGRLLIGNFTPRNHGRSYMEIFMDWHLILRDEPHMAAHAQGLSGDAEIFSDPWGNVAYARVA